MGTRQHERTAKRLHQPTAGTESARGRARRAGGHARKRTATRRDVIAPGHRRWDEFVGRFGRLRSGGPGLAGTTRVLQRMGNVDVEATLEAMRNQGAYDDGEVILNLLLR